MNPIKIHQSNKRKREREFEEMKSLFRVCWACATRLTCKPDWWNAPWTIHRAHFASNPRLLDRRLVIMLCPVCHFVSHGENYPEDDRPPLTRENMIWIKKAVDIVYFDPELIEACLIGRIPEPEPPAQYYLDRNKKFALIV